MNFICALSTLIAYTHTNAKLSGHTLYGNEVQNDNNNSPNEREPVLWMRSWSVLHTLSICYMLAERRRRKEKQQFKCEQINRKKDQKKRTKRNEYAIKFSSWLTRLFSTYIFIYCLGVGCKQSQLYSMLSTEEMWKIKCTIADVDIRFFFSFFIFRGRGWWSGQGFAQEHEKRKEEVEKEESFEIEIESESANVLLSSPRRTYSAVLTLYSLCDVRISGKRGAILLLSNC